MVKWTHRHAAAPSAQFSARFFRINSSIVLVKRALARGAALELAWRLRVRYNALFRYEREEINDRNAQFSVRFFESIALLF